MGRRSWSVHSCDRRSPDFAGAQEIKKTPLVQRPHPHGNVPVCRTAGQVERRRMEDHA